MSENIGLSIEFKTVGKANVERDASDVKQFFQKSAKESADIFKGFFKEQSKLEREWLAASDNRAKELTAIRRAQGEAIVRDFKERNAREVAIAKDADAQFTRIMQEGAAKRKALDRDTMKGQRDSHVVAYQKLLANRDTGMGPRDSHVQVYKKLQADQLALEKTNAAESVRISKIKYEQQDAHVKAFYRNQDAQAKQALRLQQRDAAQSQAAQNRSFKIGIGAIAGNGLSIGGIASVNPYAAAGLAAAYAVKNVATDLIAEATVWEKFKVALTDIEGSAVKAAQATDDLYELAKRPGIGLKEAEQTYIQFRALNMEGAKAQKVIAAVSNAVALSGGGATEFQRVNYQITQMLSKGKVLEEDLRIMRNSLPRLTVAMRDAFGTTTAEGIRKAGVNAEEFLAKIVTQFEKLPKATQTLESAQENAATAMSRLKAALVPDSAVKSGIETWTSLLEGLTEAINDVKAVAPSEGKSIIGNAMDNLDNAELIKRASKYGISTKSVMEGYFSDSNSQSGSSFAAYNQSLVKAAETKKDQPLDKAAIAAQKEAERARKQELEQLRQINLENERLKINLSSNTEFEKQRLLIMLEYKSKIEQASNDKQRDALVEQRGLQLTILHTKTLAELEKERADLAKDRARIAKEALENLARIQKEQDDNRNAQNKAKIDSGNALSFQYAPEWDKLQMEYEKQRQAIVDATFRTGEERNRVMKALNDQYLRDQAEMLTKSATAVTSAGQSLFGDIAGAMKMRSDYEYNTQKASIEKRLSLNGLEGDARVAQQRRRDEALEALDEKRQNDMQGSYLTMFMIAKGFALAESAIKLNLAIANAAASGPFPANLAAMAAVAAAVGSVVTNIAEINYAGAYDKGGFIPAGQVGLVGEVGPELVSGPARVTSRADTAAMFGAKPTVNIYNYGNDNVNVKQSSDGKSIDVFVGEVAKRAESQMATGLRSGRGEFSSALKDTFNLTRQGG